MIIIFFILLNTIIAQYCICINLIDLPQNFEPSARVKVKIRAPVIYESHPHIKSARRHQRRYWMVNEQPLDKPRFKATQTYEDETDVNLKNKISTLVEQTMHDVNRKMKTMEQLKDEFRDQAPYRVGFVLSLVRKSRDVLNELFNVAVKHKDQWRALEQLKIFELIMHTNVDTTNLLRQMVDIHLNYMNSSVIPPNGSKRRVVFL